MNNTDISPPPAKRRRLSSTSPISSTLASSIPSRPITDLEPGDLRIFSWNINGISTFLQTSITNFFCTSKNKQNSPSREISSPPQSPSLRTCLKRWRWPHVLCLQEVKISNKDIKTQQAIRRAVRRPSPSFEHKEEPSYSAYFCLPRDKFNARGFGGKVYGVCMIVRDDLLLAEGIDTGEHAKEVSWDLEGRVLLLEIPNRKVVVLNVYAVNGTENPYRNPQNGEIIGTRHDRKRAFHTELKRECKGYGDRGWKVVVAGDLNIARSPLDGFPGRRMGEAHIKNRRDFEEKFMHERKDGGLGMVDSFRALHGNEKKYSYRSPSRDWGASCDRVDLILLSSDLGSGCGPRLKEADILDEEDERGPSDHLPLYITLQLEHVKPGQQKSSSEAVGQFS